MSDKESPSKLLNKNNHITKQWDKNRRPSHWNSILTLIFNMSFFLNDKSFRETTCRFVFILVFNLCKKYMNLKTHCNKTTCRFIYYRDIPRKDMSFRKKTPIKYWFLYYHRVRTHKCSNAQKNRTHNIFTHTNIKPNGNIPFPKRQSTGILE